MAKKTTPKGIVSVTQDHIARGRQGSCTLCPIAQALFEASGCVDFNSQANEGYLRLNQRFYHVPRSCQRFMKAFDAGKKVKPFRFRLVPKGDV